MHTLHKDGFMISVDVPLEFPIRAHQSHTAGVTASPARPCPNSGPHSSALGSAVASGSPRCKWVPDVAVWC